MRYITKSRLIQFLQCGKLGFISHHQPKELPTPDLATQRVFKQGHVVGFEAQKQYPDGIMIKAPAFKMEEALKETQTLLSENKTLFEATFAFEGVLVRVDILNPVEGGWEIIEVKSSTEVKDEHINDVAIQNWVLSNCGLTIKKCSVMTINSKVTKGENIFNLFSVGEVTHTMFSQVEILVNRYKTILSKEKAPQVDIGKHCSNPYDCPLWEKCKAEKKLPKVSVLDIPNHKKKWFHYETGKVALTDLINEKWSPTQFRMIVSHLEGKLISDLDVVSNFLSQLQYPLYYLDFETEQKAVPRLMKTRPYQQVVFQYSLHIEQEDGAIEWVDYLANDESDPRETVIKGLLANLGTEGSIISYNAPFEVSRIREMAKDFPQYRDGLLALLDRFIDPLTCFREGVYHPAFQGSFSIKSVAPALLGEKASYLNLEVQDGIMAQEYFDQILSEKDEVKKQGLISALRKYCRQDTYLMVLLMDWLRAVIKTKSGMFSAIS
ncbi:MAG: DUF2779 domain-containing protein [Bdellovibrionaceae bacterium]|nr:DUF2779 domain-containing protein [Pseudobdellovibrionaceae bacterium]